MKRIMSSINKAEKGFTLIELLIVIAVLGILSSVAIPNVASFITSGKIAAANSEALSYITANQAYAAEHMGSYATASASLSAYMQGTIKGSYGFNQSSGMITYATYSDGGLTYDTTSHTFKR